MIWFELLKFVMDGRVAGERNLIFPTCFNFGSSIILYVSSSPFHVNAPDTGSVHTWSIRICLSAEINLWPASRSRFVINSSRFTTPDLLVPFFIFLRYWPVFILDRVNIGGPVWLCESVPIWNWLISLIPSYSTQSWFLSQSDQTWSNLNCSLRNRLIILNPDGI